MGDGAYSSTITVVVVVVVVCFSSVSSHVMTGIIVRLVLILLGCVCVWLCRCGAVGAWDRAVCDCDWIGLGLDHYWNGMDSLLEEEQSIY